MTHFVAVFHHDDWESSDAKGGRTGISFANAGIRISSIPQYGAGDATASLLLSTSLS
jgi:hypothetical protein